eukprot:5286-Hanusia_phi.AAC.3
MKSGSHTPLLEHRSSTRCLQGPPGLPARCTRVSCSPGLLPALEAGRCQRTRTSTAGVDLWRRPCAPEPERNS